MSRIFRLLCAATVLTVGFSAAGALAQDITILVGPKKSAAYDTAKSMADKKTVFAAKSVTNAFKTAGEQIAACPTCTFNIKIAAGDYYGKAKTGHWFFPDVVAPEATVRILGGYDDSFTSRTPFDTPSRMITADDRSRPVITFEGRKHALKELYLSGLSFDVAPGNKYDTRNNSLLKGTSSLYPILAFGYLTTDKLVIADNMFLNGAHSVAQPLIRAMSENSQILVRNNIIMNTVIAWRVNGPAARLKIKRYGLENNSFILNWPYNPDPGTSNPGTLEIGSNNSGHLIDIQKNLFAYNAGGAIHAQWDDVKGPPIAIKENLFWGNGSLFAVEDPDMAAVVGKFNGSAKYLPLTADDAEDFEWDVEDNESFDPDLKVQVQPFLAAGAKKAVMAAGAKAAPKPEAASAEAASAGGGDVNPAMAELAALLGEDAMAEAGAAEMPADGTAEAAEEAVVEDEPAMDEYADLGFGEETNTKIQNYATRLYQGGEPPFPGNPDAAGYGANADLVEQF